MCIKGHDLTSLYKELSHFPDIQKGNSIGKTVKVAERGFLERLGIGGKGCCIGKGKSVDGSRGVRLC